MPHPAVIVEDLAKRYRIGSAVAYGRFSELIENTARGLFKSKKRSSAQGTTSGGGTSGGGTSGGETSGGKTSGGGDFWALRDVNFQIDPGEVVGIIGRNGAGKSTLLKIIARITEPTAGRVRLRGRVGSLLEVGTGFHPELTGRENIYLNGAILGMTRAEIKGKFDEIVAFAEIEKFLDTPVKRYSSGMYMRLAFAVAAHLNPEILLVDEVLAVGDAAFQKKCLGKMNEVAEGGRTVLFVSHNMAAVESLCERCLYLQGGALVADGPTRDVLATYRNSHDVSQIGSGDAEGWIDLKSLPRTGEKGRGTHHVYTRMRILDEGGRPIASIPAGGDVTFELEYDAEGVMPPSQAAVLVSGAYCNALTTLNTRYAQPTVISLPRSGRLQCRVPFFGFNPGRYLLSLRMRSATDAIDMLDNAIEVEVISADALGSGELPPAYVSPLLTRCSWHCVETRSNPGEAE